MSSFAQMLIGKKNLSEMTTAGDVAPVMTGAPILSNPSATAAQRRIPTEKPDKQRKLRNRVAAGIVGQVKEDSRDGFVIPDDAKEVTKLELAGDGLTAVKTPDVPGQKIKNPYSGEEPLILPAASLVAPDVTPEAIFPLDPSQLPGGDRGQPPAAAPAQTQRPVLPGHSVPPPEPNAVVDLMLGRPNTPQQAAPPMEPAMSAESALSRLPGVPSPTAVALEETAGQSSVVLAAEQPGTPMPEHKEGNSRAIMDAFRRFAPKPKVGTPGVPSGAPSFTNV